MKRVYESPRAYVEMFTPNEYVASCVDGPTLYKFKCDAGGGKNGGLYSANWKQISNSWNSYSACGKTHNASTEDEFVRGYFDPDRWHHNGNELDVYIWIERDRWGRVTNRHATTDLDIQHWEKNQS